MEAFSIVYTINILEVKFVNYFLVYVTFPYFTNAKSQHLQFNRISSTNTFNSILFCAQILSASICLLNYINADKYDSSFSCKFANSVALYRTFFIFGTVNHVFVLSEYSCKYFVTNSSSYPFMQI